MAYNHELEIRIDKVLSSREKTESKNMFGGVCHLLNGNMFCGVYKDFLILRLGETAGDALRLPHVRPFDITGKPMKGWVMVDQEGVEDEKDLTDWLDKARAFARTLPRK